MLGALFEVKVLVLANVLANKKCWLKVIVLLLGYVREMIFSRGVSFTRGSSFTSK